MFRIVCDPSSGNIELYLTEIIRSGSLMFVVCLLGVWQRNFEPVVQHRLRTMPMLSRSCMTSTFSRWDIRINPLRTK